MNAIARIRSFVAPRKELESCFLCGSPIDAGHPHLLDSSSGKLHCACRGCSSVFPHASGKFRRVPDRVARLAEFRMTDEQWATFGIPVGIAFFRPRGKDGGALAFYPSPLGAVESTVSQEAWEILLGENEALRSMEPDVEALLVGRLAKRRECFIVPIDECYRLVGILRREWRGFTGGDEVQTALDRFFGELLSRSGGGA
jgi:hypothetical protein